MTSRTYAVALLLLLPALAAAQGSGDASKLAKATQNPISDLVSVPTQFNYFTGGGLGGQTLYNMNFQPVLPLAIGTRWNVIARTIVPYLNAPADGGARTTGVGDIVQQFFFTQQKPTDPIWGIGPIFSFPTATNTAGRTGDWGLGPAAVLVKMTGPFVLGALVTQTWTIAHDDDGRQIDQFTLQPFVNYNMADGWALAFAPTFVANWDEDEAWTIPLGLGVTKVTAIGKQPMSLGMQYYNNVIRPETTGSSQLRFVVSFLFPKAAPK